MTEGKKENLVLVHSFPTNSNLLSGFYDYLGNFFNVYPIDLPGFTKQVPPQDQVSIESYGQFVARQAERLEINDFLLGGVSFGFAVANTAKIDHRCRGIIAMEPYLNAQSLHLSPLTRLTYRALLKGAQGLGETFWRSALFKKALARVVNYPSDRVATIVSQIDRRTFFKTAQIILANRRSPRFSDLPYALVVNPQDNRVSYQHLLQTFQTGVKDFHLVHTKVDHYPQDITPAYFEARINSEDIWGMLDWFRERPNFRSPEY